MVGIKNIFLPITLGSFLVAFTNADESCASMYDTCGDRINKWCCDTTTSTLACVSRETSVSSGICAVKCNSQLDCLVSELCFFVFEDEGFCVQACVASSSCPDSMKCVNNFCIPCGQDGDRCFESACCDGFTCSSTDEWPTGVCKGNKGFSLFDISFSLKHLVGIAIVMVATWFL